MEYSYLKSYRERHISHSKLYQKIVSQFQQDGRSVDQMHFYDQILFILDQRSFSGRANRPICDELYNQTKNHEGKTSISKLAWAYIENLQTAKLCLIRDENKISQLRQKKSGLKDRDSSYVHLQIIQISVYSRFTKDAILSYEIQPTNIPPVTLQNAINPLLNHQFSFKLENNSNFTIMFMESGICIGQWSFPDQEGLVQGQYTRLIKTQNVTFEAKIKYLPKDSNSQKNTYNSQIKQFQAQKTTSKAAFENLVTFQPFLNRATAQNEIQKQREQQQAIKQEDLGMGECIPFFSSHLRNLYVLLLALVLSESFFAYFSSIQFLDIIVAFYLIAMLKDRQITSYSALSVQFLILCITMVLLIVKSFWGLTIQPFYNVQGAKIFAAVVSLILKIGVVIALTLCMNNAGDLAHQRDLYFYKGQTKVTSIEPEPVMQDNIWESQMGNMQTKSK